MRMKRNEDSMFSIQLDCAPGYIRPLDLFPDVIRGTGLTMADFKPPATFFGQWTWLLKRCDENDERFLAAKLLFEERITELFNKGLIRYGSW